MRKWVASWIHDKLDDYDLISSGKVARFALRLSIKSVAIANIADVLLHILMWKLGLLPYAMSQALVVGTVVTTLITLTITYTFGSAVGNAICKLSISHDEMARLSSTDPLSGLLNRRAFFERTGRYEADAVFILFDIDHFKAVNDVHGHLVGDRVIRSVGGVLGEVFSPSRAEVARIGGEEFSVVMSKASNDDHMGLVETARTKISAMDIGLGPVRVTVSAGVADVCREREIAQSYSLADRALYLAKSSGRNRVVHESEILRFPQTSDREAGRSGPRTLMAS